MSDAYAFLYRVCQRDRRHDPRLGRCLCDVNHSFDMDCCCEGEECPAPVLQLTGRDFSPCPTRDELDGDAMPRCDCSRVWNAVEGGIGDA